MEHTTVKTDILNPGIIISNRWVVLKRIGGGGFGDIYNAYDKFSGIKVAIKVESVKASKQILKFEVPVLKILQSSDFVCRFYAFGVTPLFSYLVMSLQGRNLADLRRGQKNHIFSLSTTLRLSEAVLKAIEDIHKVGYIHRDIKPSNFAIGRTKTSHHKVFMLDFGFARQYKKMKSSGDTKSVKLNGFHGTIRYASANVHLNFDVGRIDDLWSAFYMFAEMRVGKLPWATLQNKEDVGRMKREYDYTKLLRFLPREYHDFYRYIKNINHDETPDYAYMRRLLCSATQRYKVKPFDLFDWEIKNHDKVVDRNCLLKSQNRSQHKAIECGKSPNTHQYKEMNKSQLNSQHTRFFSRNKAGIKSGDLELISEHEDVKVDNSPYNVSLLNEDIYHKYVTQPKRLKKTNLSKIGIPTKLNILESLKPTANGRTKLATSNRDRKSSFEDCKTKFIPVGTSNLVHKPRIQVQRMSRKCSIENLKLFTEEISDHFSRNSKTHRTTMASKQDIMILHKRSQSFENIRCSTASYSDINTACCNGKPKETSRSRLNVLSETISDKFFGRDISKRMEENCMSITVDNGTDQSHN